MAIEEEIKILRQDVAYIKGVLAELVDDSVLTSEEEELVKEAREAVRRDDLSDFINLQDTGWKTLSSLLYIR
jgi:hypothetical protein